MGKIYPVLNYCQKINTYYEPGMKNMQYPSSYHKLFKK